jgi:nitroreductase/SAM-dependent methyltransferase
VYVYFDRQMNDRPKSPSPAPNAYGGVERAADLPLVDFWEIIYGRRSVRRYKTDPVDRELLEKLTNAALIAPTSCNLQMWDFVVVDERAVLEEIGKHSIQVLNAPVCIFVSYGREFSEDSYANVQSASAAIQNMSLAAHALGLGSFWITQLGDREKVREMLGVPPDRELYAGLAIGYPEVIPKKAPVRRPKDHVCHWNHYAGRHIPSSPKPSDWALEDIALYHRSRVLNGNRYNKPRLWEQSAVLEALEGFVGSDWSGDWLEFMPFSGVLTMAIRARFKTAKISVCELTLGTASFAKKRATPDGGLFVWPDDADEAGGERLPTEAFDLVTCLFRLEALPPQHRSEALQSLFAALRPGGKLLLGFCNRRSYHGLMERARRGRMGGVEYVLAPEPHLGPFQALDSSEVFELVKQVGFKVTAKHAVHALPSASESEFRTRNLKGPLALTGKVAALCARAADSLPGIASTFGRLQFLCLEKPS